MKKDSNGYVPSIMGSEDGIDFFSGCPSETVRHEIFNASNRQKSKEDGLWVALTPLHHEMVHRTKEEGSAWHKLMVEAECRWLAYDWTRTIQDFVDRYGKNYL